MFIKETFMKLTVCNWVLIRFALFVLVIMSEKSATVAKQWRISGNNYSVLLITFADDDVGVGFNDNDDYYGQKFAELTVENPRTNHVIRVKNLFEITLRDGKNVSSQDFLLDEVTQEGDSLQLVFKNGSWRANATVTMYDKAKYGSVKITIQDVEEKQDIALVSLMPFHSQAPFVYGATAASPIISDSFFLIPGNPLTQTLAYEGDVLQTVVIAIPLEPGQALDYKTYIGTWQEGQLRRDVNLFLNHARHRKYSPYLHYNSWLDIGYFSPYTERDALLRIDQIGKALVTERGVRLSAFLFDDGWDDLTGSWKFNKKNFPQEFKNLKAAAAKYDAHLGIWLSPWGGYNQPREERVSHAPELGYEVIAGKFALSGPKYYSNFQRRVMDMITRQNITLYKIDGTGNTDRVVSGSRFTSDFDAAIHLLDDMRRTEQNLFISLTTGTKPTPSWLFLTDSIWRNGDDVNFYGKGSRVQQWITYRDAQTYRDIVRKGPLFPLNSLMLHGIVYAKQAKYLDKQSEKDFADQVWSYFASGTQLQELYITPDLLTDADWDNLANAANWAWLNKDVLLDSHWIGKDPTNLDVYGWAAWSPKKSLITLRNPSYSRKVYYLDLQSDLELSADNPAVYQVHIEYGQNEMLPSFINQTELIILQPLDLLILSLVN